MSNYFIELSYDGQNKGPQTALYPYTNYGSIRPTLGKLFVIGSSGRRDFGCHLLLCGSIFFFLSCFLNDIVVLVRPTLLPKIQLAMLC